MQYETAHEIDSMLTPIEAAVETLDVIREHFCNDHNPLSCEDMERLDQSLWSVYSHLRNLIDIKQSECDTVFAKMQEVMA